MKLEEELKQKEFQSIHERLGVNLIFTNNWLMPKLRAFFQEYEITHAQYNILRILRGQHPNPVPISLLIERMIFKQSDVSRLVDRLYAKNLVDRRICSKDRRKMDVLISDEGLALLAQIDAPLIARQKEILGNLSETDIRQLNNLLDKLR